MSRLTLPVNPTDHVLGGDGAIVTLVEYGDFECPACGQAQPIVAKALRRMSDDLRFAYRHFPLAKIRPHALSAVLASEAAGAQGQFWGMHDLLFENQDALEDEDLIVYAEDLGLDVDRFVVDFEDDVYLDKVRSDFRSGVRSGASGTPTFFLEGMRFDGNWSDGTLVEAIASVIRAKKAGVAPVPPP